jgi:hypothetical protein
MLQSVFNRRELLLQGGAGFGALALCDLLGGDLLGGGLPAAEKQTILQPTNDLSPLHRPTAKSVIFVFLEGGPSHIDLFDPKPLLHELAGQPLPKHIKKVITPMGVSDAPLMAAPRTWKQHGQCGTWVSEWLPEIATCVDDIAVIRSCFAEGLNHSNGVCQMNSCSIRAGRPSLGSWVSYGLGTENQDLPAFVVIEDAPGKVVNGPRNWGTGFMPSRYQGTPFRSSGEPIEFLETPQQISKQEFQIKADLLARLNRQHADQRQHDDLLETRIKSYELAYRMQAAAPEAIDLNHESAATRNLYGIDEKETADFGRNCLLARRLVERGVRFVQLYHGSGSRWDAHSDIESNHSSLCRASDKPVAGLIKDLKQRGLLDETLVIWGGEFGRTPMTEKKTGRDHNPYGFTMWMAGGGVRGGQVIGTTDEVGLHAVEDRLHVRDLHASILYALGIDHMALTYLNNGSPERPTINEGTVCKKLFA